MSLESAMYERKDIRQLLKVGNIIREDGDLEVEVGNRVSSDFKYFLNEVLGEELVDEYKFHYLREKDITVLTELLFLKFNDIRFSSDFDFDMHSSLSEVEEKYSRYIRKKKELKNEINKLKSEISSLDNEVEKLDDTWFD